MWTLPPLWGSPGWCSPFSFWTASLTESPCFATGGATTCSSRAILCAWWTSPSGLSVVTSDCTRVQLQRVPQLFLVDMKRLVCSSVVEPLLQAILQDHCDLGFCSCRHRTRWYVWMARRLTCGCTTAHMYSHVVATDEKRDFETYMMFEGADSVLGEKKTKRYSAFSAFGCGWGAHSDVVCLQ